MSRSFVFLRSARIALKIESSSWVSPCQNPAKSRMPFVVGGKHVAYCADHLPYSVISVNPIPKSDPKTKAYYDEIFDAFDDPKNADVWFGW